MIPKKMLPVGVATLVALVTACQSATTAEDTLVEYIKAVQANEVAKQNKLQCSDGKLSGSLEGIRDWKVVSFQKPDEEGGGIFYVNSNDKTWEVSVRKTERIYQNTVETINDGNASSARAYEVIKKADEILGGEPPEPPEFREIPKRSDYSSNLYCVVNVR